MPGAAIAKHDRHLDHLEAAADRPVGHLDLEGVAAGRDRVEVDRLQHLAAEALEATGQVADVDAEDEPRPAAKKRRKSARDDDDDDDDPRDRKKKKRQEEAAKKKRLVLGIAAGLAFLVLVGIGVLVFVFLPRGSVG